MALSRQAKQHVLGFDQPVIAPDHEHEIYLLVNDDEARALLAGNVPDSIKAQARAAIDWEFDLIRCGRRREYTSRKAGTA